MKLKLVIIVLTIIFAGVYAYWDMTRTPSGAPLQSDVQHPLPTAPDATLTDINGKTYRLYDFKGKHVLVNFWATWCPPCVVEMPDLLKLAEREKERLVLITVSADREAKTIAKFFDKIGFEGAENIILAHDPNGNIAQKQFAVFTYPESYIIAPDMTIKRKVIGVIDWLDEDLF